MIEAWLARGNYVAFVLLVAIGLFVMIDDRNLIKKVIGLNIFQTGVFLLFISAGYRTGARPPIITDGGAPYANPLPQVLMLTAIVVGVSVTAVALALIVRLHREYGTLREDRISEAIRDD